MHVKSDQCPRNEPIRTNTRLALYEMEQSYILIFIVMTTQAKRGLVKLSNLNPMYSYGSETWQKLQHLAASSTA